MKEERKPLKYERMVDTMIKMTKKAAFTMAQEALSTIETEEARQAWDVIQKEIDRLERTALKAKSGETKDAKEKAEFRQGILEFITDQGAAFRASEIATEFGVSGQKVTAALTKLVEEGALERFVGEKRAIMFRVPAAK